MGAHALEVFLVDLCASVCARYVPMMIEAPNMPAADAKVDFANLHIASFLGVYNGVVYTPFCGFEIDELSLTDAPGRGVPAAQNLQRIVVPCLRHNHADFNAPAFQSYKNPISSHCRAPFQHSLGSYL